MELFKTLKTLNMQPQWTYITARLDPCKQFLKEMWTESRSQFQTDMEEILYRDRNIDVVEERRDMRREGT
jgi:hypothetical protein